MLFERHHKGKIFGGEADVCPDSTLCKHSFVGGKSDIWKSSLKISKVENAKVRLSELERAVVSGGEIVSSILQGSVFEGGTVLGSRLYTATVKGGLIRNSVILNSEVKDFARAINATLIGVTIDRKMRVEGIWERQPRYFELENSIASVGITEDHNGHAFIGCTSKPMKVWLKKRTLWQKAIGWNDVMCNQIVKTFEEWMEA